MPSFPDLNAPLRGDRVALRPAAERDIPEVLIAHQDDPDLHVRLGLRRPPSGAELGRRVEGGPADREAGTAVWLTIVRLGEDDCIGQIDVHEVDSDHDRAQLGIWVALGERGRGFGGEALGLAARWLLTDGGLERVQLLTEPGNIAMLRAAQAAGFAREGVLYAYLRERGARVDCEMLSLITADVGAR
ncbi:MAG: GNAT family protein [Solirubrobacteraceae bacterium]